jgi:hypothetical protein
MKIEPNDAEFFKALSNSETGGYLADYSKRVIDYVYDSRSWEEGDTKESAEHAARLIRTLLLEKIRPNPKKDGGTIQYE